MLKYPNSKILTRNSENYKIVKVYKDTILMYILN